MIRSLLIFLGRTAGVLFWLTSLGLTAMIVRAYTGSQGPIASGLAILAVVGSAVGSVMAHKRWEAGCWGLAALCFLGFVFGEMYLIPMEIGYWASQVQSRAEDREMAELHHKTKVAELNAQAAKAWGEPIRDSGAIQAERVSELSKLVPYVNDRGYEGSTKSLREWTNSCENQNHWAYRKGHCARYMELGVELAKAIGAEAARKELGQGSRETLEPVADPHAGDKWFARQAPSIGAEGWADIFMISGVVLLGFCRDATLLFTFASWPVSAVRTPDSRTVSRTVSRTAGQITVKLSGWPDAGQFHGQFHGQSGQQVSGVSGVRNSGQSGQHNHMIELDKTLSGFPPPDSTDHELRTAGQRASGQPDSHAPDSFTDSFTDSKPVRTPDSRTVSRTVSRTAGQPDAGRRTRSRPHLVAVSTSQAPASGSPGFDRKVSDYLRAGFSIRDIGVKLGVTKWQVSEAKKRLARSATASAG